MKNKLLKIMGGIFLALMILPIFAKPMEAKAATYFPYISDVGTTYDATYNIGSTAELKFRIVTGTINASQGMEILIYDAYGNRVLYDNDDINEYYDYTRYTYYWNTSDMSEGRYTVEVHALYYSSGSWYFINSSDYILRWNVYLVRPGQWKHDGYGWWYQRGNGSYPVSQWEAIGGTWYYFNASGYMVTGWQNLGGTWYYFDGNGAMTTGWKALGGTWYYFDGNGAMATGWQNLGGTWYYFDGSGAMVTGWRALGGTWYYFDGSGAMATGWKALGGTWYYFNGSGAMVTGWQLINGEYYYFASSGAMVSDTWVGDYYMQASGAMATNKWIGEYYVGADGKWIPGYVEPEIPEEPEQPEEPEEPENPMDPSIYAQNLQVLKNYIVNYGSLNNSGNRFIKTSYTDDGYTYTFGIVYDSTMDELNFSFIGTGSVNTSLSMTVKNIDNGNLPTEFIVLLESGAGGASASATINPSTYSKDQYINFVIDSIYGLPSDTVRNLADSSFHLAMVGWDILLGRAGLTMSDIGFVNYQSE